MVAYLILCYNMKNIYNIEDMIHMIHMIPHDVFHFHVKKFIFCECSKCKKQQISNDVSFDIYFKKYVSSVFDDDFYIITSDADFYKILCHKCYYFLISNKYYPIRK